MLQYITAREAAEKWSISQRRVSVLCAENRIPDVAMLGNMWIIPRDAEKPADARRVKAVKRSESARPFVKWAGGKSQLLDVLKGNLPNGIGTSLRKYAEPFVGGGALLFSLLGNYSFDEVYICDNNRELINTYSVIKNRCDELIELLSFMQSKYGSFETVEEKQEYYYLCRKKYNNTLLNDATSVEKAALFVLLNKTCFNGLYRVNRKGEFNVPFGKREKPTVCDTDNLLKASKALQKVSIHSGDYHGVLDFADKETFVYFDPPYRPLNATSGFTSYTEEQFSDADQIELSKTCRVLSNTGARVMISNSDPHNVDESDDFFDDLYAGFDIKRVEAARMINSNGASRGKVKELLIKNY